MRNMTLVLAGIAVLVSSSALANAGDIYALNMRTASGQTTKLFSFSPATPNTHNIILDPTPYVTYAMDFDSAGTTLYMIKNVSATEWEFGRVNPADGSYLAIGMVSGLPGAPSDLTIDPTTETFYVATGANLYTLNPITGVASLVAPFTAPTTELVIDLAIDRNGRMYAHGISSDALYGVNKTTGALTLIGNHGLTANYAQGMDFDYATNTLYATIYTGAGTGKFVSWNTGDGSITILADTTPWNMEMEMAVSSPIPEPASLALLGLGALLLRRR